MIDPVAYCGSPPLPGQLVDRINLDPILIAGLIGVGLWHLLTRGRNARAFAAGGWLIVATALLSPLCALSVALFSARVAQHMILLLVAAPLLAQALPSHRAASVPRLVATTGAFTLLLWAWHMPLPYDASLRSTPLYWAMHVSLLGSAVLLWRELLHARAERLLGASMAGLAASIQMGLLGAILALAPAPLFRSHILTSGAWGLSPLEDQQLGGLLMWVPGLLGFLWLGLMGVSRMMRGTDQGTINAGSV